MFASVRNTDENSHKRILSYPKEVNYLLNKYAMFRAIANKVALIFSYKQPADLTPLFYSDIWIAEKGKITEGIDKRTMKDIFIDGADAPFRGSLDHYRQRNP